MTDPNRYEGKPFLRLIDSYVFWAIGELSERDGQSLLDMTPRLQEVYGSGGSWQEIVAEQMEYPDSLPERLREMWEDNQRIARERQESLPPHEFVVRVVDTNLVT